MYIIVVLIFLHKSANIASEREKSCTVLSNYSFYYFWLVGISFLYVRDEEEKSKVEMWLLDA